MEEEEEKEEEGWGGGKIVKSSNGFFPRSSCNVMKWLRGSRACLKRSRRKETLSLPCAWHK